MENILRKISLLVFVFVFLFSTVFKELGLMYVFVYLNDILRVVQFYDLRNVQLFDERQIRYKKKNNLR